MRQDRPQHAKNSTIDHKSGKSVKLLKVYDLGIHLTRPNGTYFKLNYGRWPP